MDLQANVSFLLLYSAKYNIRQAALLHRNIPHNSTSSENAARELKEEIGATIVNEPILLGNVISDSGLTGNRVDVYLVEIESFQQNQLIHEGIKQIIEIPVNKMDDWIRQGKIDDGFSLSAYALYQSHIK